MAFFISTNTKFSGVFFFFFAVFACNTHLFLFSCKIKVFFYDSVLDCLVVMILNILIIIIITS